MDPIVRLKFITTWTAIAISIVVMLTIPVVYGSAVFVYYNAYLKSQVNNTANKISEIIYIHPESWQYQHHRVEDIIAHKKDEEVNAYYKIQDRSGETVMDSGEAPGFPSYMVYTELSDGEKVVGKLSLEISLMSLITDILWTVLIGIVLALLVYFTLRLLPFSALAKATDSLLKSQQEKDQALSEQKKISQQLRYQSLHDSLTGLANRSNYIQVMNESLSEHTLSRKNFWTIIIDLDRFKEINDALGHSLGDHVLQETAKRLRLSTPEKSLVARLGGDEYAVLIPDVDISRLEGILAKMLRSVRSHIHTQGFHLAVDASIGAAEFPTHGVTQQDLMRHADMAMYHAKSSGISWAYYDEKFETNSLDRLSLTAELRHALDNDLLQLYFQPKILLASEEIIGIEALARWEHAEFGFISPDVFIPIAEQSNMIHGLTKWVILESLRALQQLHDLINNNFNVAINVSARNLHDERFSYDLKQMVEESNIPEHKLTLEITETSIMHDSEQSQIVVQKLSDLGFNIAIDDFGTGYSSLAYLKKLASNQVKIDRTFITNLLEDKDDRIIVRSTINLAHSLGMEVVAEGVEDQETCKMLKAMGCEYAQGYYFGRPMPMSELIDVLQQSSTNEA